MSYDVERKMFRGGHLDLSMHGYPVLDVFPAGEASSEGYARTIEQGDMMIQLDHPDVRWLRDQLNDWLKQHDESESFTGTAEPVDAGKLTGLCAPLEDDDPPPFCRSKYDLGGKNQ